MRRRHPYELRGLAGMIYVALLLMGGFHAFAQMQVPDCEIRTEAGGRLNNASTPSADLSAGAPDSRLILGRKVFFDDHTSVACRGCTPQVRGTWSRRKEVSSIGKRICMCRPAG
jgi:hypothetical protein